MKDYTEEDEEEGTALLGEETQRALQKLQAVAVGEASEVLELALLRRQLEHQKQETANAMLAANELRRQIQEAQESKQNKRKKSIPPTVAQPAEISRLKNDVDLARSALDKERRARQSDLEEMEQLRSSVRVSQVYGRPRKNHLGTVKVVVTVVMLLGIIGGAAYGIHSLPIIQSALSVWDVKEVPVEPAAKVAEAIASDTIGKLTSFGGGGSDFSRAISRLDRVLNSFPGKPQDVLKAVKNMNSTEDKTVCGFEWANGQPAIIYEGNKPGNRGMTIATTVNNCADAVEQFLASAEKDAAANAPAKP